MNDAIRLDLPADVRFLRVAAACVAELLAAMDPESAGAEAARTQSHDLQLAVQELCANIATHAYDADAPGRLTVSLAVHDDLFTADVVDRGRPFDPASAAPPNLEDGQVHGYGLFLINSLVDEVTHRYDGGENHWRLTKRLR